MTEIENDFKTNSNVKNNMMHMNIEMSENGGNMKVIKRVYNISIYKGTKKLGIPVSTNVQYRHTLVHNGQAINTYTQWTHGK